MKRWISCIGCSCVRRTSPSNAMNLMVGRFAMTTTAHTLYTKSPAFYVPVRRKVAHRTKEYSDEANNFQDGDEEKETRSRGRPRRLGEGYEEELAQLEQAEKGISSVEDTEAALHQMEYIPEELINTIRSLKIVSEFRAGNCKDRIRRVCALLSNTHRVQHMGNCLYFRVVHKMGGPNGHRSGPEKAMKQVVEHIHKILGEFTVSTISLTPNEVVGDVTNYGHATPLLMAATTNLKQYIRDVDAVVTAHNFEKVPTYPPPSEEELIPYQSDEIAKDVAFRLREYIQKVVCDTRVAVCIGVANTAAMAKIACEAEVTALTRQQANGGNSSSVRVRSFSRYLHSIDSAQEFVKKLPVSCIPTFTPAFIEMLQSVFGIVNCQQLSDELEMLFFCFGRTTFVACYDAIFGRMRFPEEDNVLLFSHHSHTNFPVLIDSLARNSVTITNASRTAVSGSVLSSSRESRRTRKVGWIEMSKGYGRLISDAELTKVVETLATSMHRELLQRSMYVETVRLELQVDGEIHYRAFTTIQRTQSRALIGRGVTALLSKALAHRARSRSSTMSAGTNVVAITFQKLTARSMLPPGMVKEMEETIAMYLHHRMRLKSSAAYARIRKGEKYVPAHRLEAPKEHKINPTYRKIAARLSSG